MYLSKYSQTLLHSDFRPHHPELGYPVIEAESSAERIIAVFQDNAVIDLGAKGKPVYILNASGRENVCVRNAKGRVRPVKVPCGDYKKL